TNEDGPGDHEPPYPWVEDPDALDSDEDAFDPSRVTPEQEAEFEAALEAFARKHGIPLPGGGAQQNARPETPERHATPGQTKPPPAPEPKVRNGGEESGERGRREGKVRRKGQS